MRKAFHYYTLSDRINMIITTNDDKAHNYARCVTYYELTDGRKLLWMMSRKDYEGSVPLEHIKDDI